MTKYIVSKPIAKELNIYVNYIFYTLEEAREVAKQLKGSTIEEVAE